MGREIGLEKRGSCQIWRGSGGRHCDFEENARLGNDVAVTGRRKLAQDSRTSDNNREDKSGIQALEKNRESSVFVSDGFSLSFNKT